MLSEDYDCYFTVDVLDLSAWIITDHVKLGFTSYRERKRLTTAWYHRTEVNFNMGLAEHL